ncbi:MerR family transcriptional regulator [Pseudogulbenkiania subflava]|uniref:DNA-binding transcriptional regulator, MerR family n=1 Tax=Pseudogulbenkiania subflava DSM 22618 TaxID=1123014 RepID=A0A1Y6BKL4_9NEIS|nr:MerR family transcriptional regulator [Pseudogulbenkiania subflava]SMF07546.1 DNA-binding transcriptional regulator, MerR family [Pseudogulbenkiania subflava DSM 22618]
MPLKVGELAKRTGLTVRALHHYDSIGLLKPSARSDSGYRLYNQADIARLYRIQSLQRLGFALAEIGAMLAGDGTPLPQLIEQQIAALDLQITQACALRSRLATLQQTLAADQEPTLADWLNTLELMTMYDKYLTTQQAETLRQRKAKLGDHYDATWRVLTDQVRALIAAKVPPQAAEAQALAQQWTAHTQTLVHGDENLLIKLDAMHRNEPALQAQSGIDEAVLEYIGQAMTEVRMPIYAKYFDADEMARLRRNFRRHMAEWPRLVGVVRAAMDSGLTPDHPDAHELGARWQALSDATFCTDEPAMRDKFLQAVRNEPSLMLNTGIDCDMINFVITAQGKQRA